ncbi:SulP family inorganic anion transporter [Clostridium sp. BJN0001]|uniref:SulP family inorganic anion transporter n=1 Tax=Clostridium sp. BJN0001 TaxID=2930219 RepID=UPI001FD420DE|nr:SulP family inorganic anion transporter [Clostridium sp. BJN0001]
MQKSFFGCKDYRKEYISKDIISGIIVALISIPISMGYAQVGGLPVVYGLYGSLFPVIIFGILSTSPQFVFGVDAAPAALVGGVISNLGIITGSEDAMKVVPIITLITGVWLIIFYFLRAGRLVRYISKPVLAGFITGIGSTIIMMQVPKLFGGSSGTGEIFKLIINIYNEFSNFNMLSFIMSMSTIIIILFVKKVSSKFPTSVVMLIAGALSTILFHVDRYGVKLLPEVSAGLPRLKELDFSILINNPETLVIESLTIALVIVSSTLLTANSYAIKNNYKIKNGREIFAYAISNISASLFGCCPLNGSVSRTSMAEQFGAKSQIMSIVSGITMMFILLFGTGIIAYLPVPVLTGIVLAALIGILEIGVAKRLWKTDKGEFAIFIGAFAGVLIMGTIYGVLIGVILSFVSVILKASVPPREMLGVIPGFDGYYGIERNKNAHKIKNVVIYRFSGTLFFANIDTFQQDIENEISDDTKVVIVDASGIGNVDITAVERLVLIAKKLKNKGIRFYITEHVGAVNDKLRKLGAEEFINNGFVRRTITLALRDAKIEYPYELEDKNGITPIQTVRERNDTLFEFEWAFGKDAGHKMEMLAMEVLESVSQSKEISVEKIKRAEINAKWGRIGLFDENELLDRLEMHINEIAKKAEYNTEDFEETIEKRRSQVERKLQNLNPDAIAMIKKQRIKVSEHFKEVNLTAFNHINEIRKKHIERLQKTDPDLAEKMKEFYDIKDEV